MFLLTYGLAVSVPPAAAGGHPVAGYWLAASGFAGLFLAALFAHEYAHGTNRAALRHPGPLDHVMAAGWCLELDGEPPRPRADLLIALAGLAGSLAAAGVFLAVAESAAAAGLTLLAAGFG